MGDEARSGSENEEIGEKSSSEKVAIRGVSEVSEYEKQRLLRIRENKARLEALRLPSLASSLLNSVENLGKRKGKGKKDGDDDEEYRPSDGEKRASSSSEDDDEEEEEGNDDDDDVPRNNGCSSSGSRRASIHKGKKGSSLNKKRTKKKVSVQKNKSETQYIDDDEALRQALALSLEDSPEASDTVIGSSCKNIGTEAADVDLKESKNRPLAQEDYKRKKRRKSNTSRVQMSEEQVIIHFYNFDGSGKESISVKDLKRVATAHDFTWTDKEMVDMIHCFDSDGDGKLSLEDFRKIVYRCNMIRDCQAQS